MDYNHNQVEKKWKEIWNQQQLYKVENNSEKPKYYILDMFPYPSGAGLHVGHPLGYIASDIVARYKRLRGFNVLHPMGYDAFGLPAEQYAIQTGVHPAISTEQNIARYKQQLDNIGFSFDWSRSVNTSDPNYYKWTQWIFLKLFNSYFDLKENKAKHLDSLIEQFEATGNQSVEAANTQEGIFSAEEWKNFSAKQKDDVLMNYRLAYRKVGYVNWCEALGTVLANDEVKDGVSERGGFPVIKKPMMQWSLRITAYAERLLRSLDHLEWSESLKTMQENWIGRSEGAQVFFDIEGSDEKLEIFTTRPDTIFGATFMVLAPEHDLVAQITTSERKHEVDKYIAYVQTRTDRERQAEVKEMTGVFTGAYVIHPFTQEKLPIWLGDYVLKDYGTGAIMAVPSDDDRDKNFATKYQLPIVDVVDKSEFPKASLHDKVGRMINSDFLDGILVHDAIQLMITKLEELGIGKKRVNYKLRDANYSRQRYWGEPFPIKYNEEGIAIGLQDDELPLTLPDLEDFKPSSEGKSPLARVDAWVSEEPGFTRDTDTMPGFAGSSWYFLRYMDAGNQNEFASREALEYWKEVDLYIGGTEHAVGHLMYSRFWHKVLFDLGFVPTDEPFKKLVNQGMIQGRSNFVYRANERFFEDYLKFRIFLPILSDLQFVKENVDDLSESSNYDWSFLNSDWVIEVTSGKQIDKINRIKEIAASRGKKLLVLSIEYLTENINTPEIIAQVIHNTFSSDETFKVIDTTTEVGSLYVSYNLTSKYDASCFTPIHVDVNYVYNDFLQLERLNDLRQFENAYFKLDPNQQFQCSWEVEKMSKSKYNVVNPDQIVAQYGCDCFRMYEMFLGPIEQSKPWDTKGIDGVSKFLRKFWNLFHPNEDFHISEDAPTKAELKILHSTLKKISNDIEKMSMNTCVSAFMVCVNELKSENCNKRSILEPLVIALAPFAPFIAEELWNKLGHETSVHTATFPEYDPAFLVEDEFLYPICINGKKREEYRFPSSATKEEITNTVLALEEMKKWLDKPVQKVIIVEGRMINLVV